MKKFYQLALLQKVKQQVLKILAIHKISKEIYQQSKLQRSIFYYIWLIALIRQIIILTVVQDDLILQNMGNEIKLVGTALPYLNKLLAINKQGCLLQIEGNYSLCSEDLFNKALVFPLYQKFQPFLNGVWLKFKKTLVVYEEGSIHTIYFNQNLQIQKIQKKQCFGLTCCGASLNSENSLAAIGDLSGKVKIFEIQNKFLKEESNEQSKQIKTNKIIDLKQIEYKNSNFMGIRCIQFHPQRPNILAFGTLSTGEISIIRISQKQKVQGPKLLVSLNTTVTVIKWSPLIPDRNNFYLACGLITGEIVLLQINKQTFECQSMKRFTAHSTGDKSQSFGSLNIQAQIWSLCWNPKIKNQTIFEIASCSQDQTLKLWSIDLTHDQKGPKFSSIVQVKDHTRAVTCVNWVYEGDHQLLISCSDDQNVFIYKREQFDKLKIIRKFNSSGLVSEWHTLTYMKYQTGLVAVGTQNGYLLIFDIASNEQKSQDCALVYGKKIHGGGIQGLDWNKNCILVCSNDCGGTLIVLDQI